MTEQVRAFKLNRFPKLRARKLQRASKGSANEQLGLNILKRMPSVDTLRPYDDEVDSAAGVLPNNHRSQEHRVLPTDQTKRRWNKGQGQKTLPTPVQSRESSCSSLAVVGDEGPPTAAGKARSGSSSWLVSNARHTSVAQSKPNRSVVPLRDNTHAGAQPSLNTVARISPIQGPSTPPQSISGTHSPTVESDEDIQRSSRSEVIVPPLIKQSSWPFIDGLIGAISRLVAPMESSPRNHRSSSVSQEKSSYYRERPG